jgi:hypothetical protein
MITFPISILLFLIIFFLWKKYKHPQFFWQLFPVGVFILLWIYQWLSGQYFDLNSAQRSIEELILLGSRIAIFIAFLYIGYLGVKRWK